MGTLSTSAYSPTRESPSGTVCGPGEMVGKTEVSEVSARPERQGSLQPAKAAQGEYDV